MALLYRKKVRDAILSLLTTSFNSTLDTVCAAYGVDPFVLDFSDGSPNFAVSHIDPVNIENCQFQQFPAMCIYTTDAVDNGSPRALSFAGQLIANADIYLRYRDGAEGTNTEDIPDAIEEAFFTLLNTATWPAGVLFQRQTKLTRETIVPLSDGFYMRIPISTLFEVYVN